MSLCLLVKIHHLNHLTLWYILEVFIWYDLTHVFGTFKNYCIILSRFFLKKDSYAYCILLVSYLFSWNCIGFISSSVLSTNFGYFHKNSPLGIFCFLFSFQSYVWGNYNTQIAIYLATPFAWDSNYTCIISLLIVIHQSVCSFFFIF